MFAAKYQLKRVTVATGGGAMGAYALPPPRQAKMVRVVEYLGRIPMSVFRRLISYARVTR